MSQQPSSRPWTHRRAILRSCSVALLAMLLVSCAGAGDSPAAHTRAIIDDLVAQEFGRATARYRQQEDKVLSAAAAPTWRQALDHGDPTVRQWAVDALSRIGEPEDVPRLVERLDDRFRDVREAAAEGLVRMDRDVAREELLQRLRSEEPAQVTLAAGALADMGAGGVTAAIVERLRDPSLPEAVRGTLTTALARSGDPAAAPPLADLALDGDVGLQVRRLAAEALAALQGDGVEAQLRRLLEADDDYVRQVAAEALGR